MRKILIKGINGLIGDFLGQIPILQELSKEYEIYIELPEDVRSIYNLIPKKYNIREYDKEQSSINFSQNLDIHTAFSEAGRNNWYMSQAYYPQIGLSVPEMAPKADLSWDFEWVPYYDFLLSPFARSLPSSQKLEKENWQELVNRMPDKRFALLGNSKYDDREYISGENVFVEFDKPFDYICNLFKSHKTRNPMLISLVTGTSHLAFHIDAPNILLTNQGDSGWGINPDSTKITSYIKNIKARDIINVINEIKYE